jgi:hypothetical protein
VQVDDASPGAALALLAPGVLVSDRPVCPYEPLIGSWDVAARWFVDEAPVREAEGEWHFSWILGGWGVQDVLFVKGAPPDQRGTTVRCYDQSSECWRVAWMAPRGEEFVTLSGRSDDGSIVQQGVACDGSSHQRCTFSDITELSFIWGGGTSTDSGQAWRLDQEMRATRRAARRLAPWR